MPEAPAQLKADDFERIRRLARDQFGLDLRSGKEALVAARLGKKLRELSFDSFEAYFRHVQADRTGEALLGMIDALTTNHTSFLREPAHFSVLTSRVWPALERRAQICLWSAACSTGEEPYSILLTLLEHAGAGVLPRIRIVASDISSSVLATAAAAVYRADQLAVLPPEWLRRYFLRGDGRWAGMYRLRPELRRAVEFRRVNLIEPVAAREMYPVIFCRNVMIYFDKETQERAVGELTNALEPGGYLLIGHAESLMGMSHGLEYVQPAVYRKSERPGRQP